MADEVLRPRAPHGSAAGVEAAMARPSRAPVRAWLRTLAALATLVVLTLLMAPGAAGAVEAEPRGASGIEPAAPRPGESCPDETPAPGSTGEFCDDVAGPDVGAGTGIDLGVLLPILAVALVAGAVALAAAYMVQRRRASVPFAPAEPGEQWWTCRNCGKNNVAGSPRCFACGTWQS